MSEAYCRFVQPEIVRVSNSRMAISSSVKRELNAGERSAPIFAGWSAAACAQAR